MYHFFVDEIQIAGERIRVSGADYNHMKNAVRLKEGDNVFVSTRESASGNYLCRIVRYAKESAELEILQENAQDNELPCRVTLYQGLPKSDKMELIIQKAVELGVYDIVPVAMGRCVVKLDEKRADAKIARWNAVSESAAKQSGRSLIPKVGKVLSFKQALTEAQDCDIGLIPYENEAGMQETRKLLGSIQKDAHAAVFIGPEGGFEEEEIRLAREKGMKTITLGKRILRTETAGMALLAMLAYALEN